MVGPISTVALTFLLLLLQISTAGSIATNEQDHDNIVNEYNQATDKSLLWGPYRPNAYIGIRPRLDRSLISGLFWFNSDSMDNLNKIRHYCDQSLDFQGFGWERYDPRIGGEQVFKDNEFKLDLRTYFVKNQEDGNWALRVKGTPRAGFENSATSLVFYTGLESDDPDNDILLSSFGTPKNGLDKGESVKLLGSNSAFGEFEIEITDGPTTNKHKSIPSKQMLDSSLDPSKTHYLSLRVPNDNVWRAEEIFQVLIQESVQKLVQDFPDPKLNPDSNSLLQLRDLQGFEGNLHFVQKTFVGEFEFDIIFNVEKSEDKFQAENLGVKINDTLKQFDSKFNNKIKLQPPFQNVDKYEKFAKEILSNLLGGIGYYHGDHLVDRESEFNEETYEKIQLKGESEGPFTLFTASPSRTFFPRGFYWDEGFHLIPMLQYDMDLTLEILKSWFDLIDEDGWIAREQILGEEARSKVPTEFQVQSPKIANPPTLMLVFESLLKRVAAATDTDADTASFNQLGDIDSPIDVEKFDDITTTKTDSGISQTDIFNGESHLKHPQLMMDYAREIYPKLQTHYEWFRTTQRGELEEFEREPTYPTEAYRWRGRTFTHCLPSGLDDYPRAPIPDIAELNVDLISWIGVMTRSMKEIAKLLDMEDDYQRYSRIEKEIMQNIQDLHWSDKEKTYCDVSVDGNDEDMFVCNKGYISLFPFLLKQIDASNLSNLKHIVELISNPKELFTNYGIRSLSRQNKFYKTGEDYWRSPIWYNINYLILDSLKHYTNDYATEELFQLANKTYTQTRLNLVNNAFKHWKKTGYLYEQYNDVNGSPKGAKHFTGWTSLIVSIMAMPESLVRN
ncbi:hypothetical protein WICPIJ_009401 [Wickerhamomyces pijperi]|uniref:Mannosyl-oligosaccharide glucosidase n=1 Tax=Wickerhamomyces pijperi TaxID=599730 RepID=A0A9P8TDC0_WICPI|nr:hypothetical protein WICPIJ_009401 [Wickerhamomyces pijperi]